MLRPPLRRPHDDPRGETRRYGDRPVATVRTAVRAAARGLSVGSGGRVSKSAESRLFRSGGPREVAAACLARREVFIPDEAAYARDGQLDRQMVAETVSLSSRNL